MWILDKFIDKFPFLPYEHLCQPWGPPLVFKLVLWHAYFCKLTKSVVEFRAFTAKPVGNDCVAFVLCDLCWICLPRIVTPGRLVLTPTSRIWTVLLVWSWLSSLQSHPQAQDRDCCQAALTDLVYCLLVFKISWRRLWLFLPFSV